MVLSSHRIHQSFASGSEEYIKNQILAPRIKQCSTVVVYVSSETKESDYVNWEVEHAQRNDKRIIGVWAQGEKGCELPEALSKYADAIVGWTGNRIIDASLLQNS